MSLVTPDERAPSRLWSFPFAQSTPRLLKGDLREAAELAGVQSLAFL
jgi:hypothetical protein